LIARKARAAVAVATGGIWWAYPPKQSTKPPKLKYILNTIDQWSFYKIINVKPPCTNVKPPIKDFLASALVALMVFSSSKCTSYVSSGVTGFVKDFLNTLSICQGCPPHC